MTGLAGNPVVEMACEWRSEPSIVGHGGNHRSAQLFHLATDAGIRCVSADGAAPLGRIGALSKGWATYRRLSRPLGGDWRLRETRFHGLWRARFEEVRGTHPHVRCFLWEATQLIAKGPIAREVGWRVIAAPQNLECLHGALPDRRLDRRRRLAELEREVESLAAADEIFCIGDEDAWLLRGLGLRPQVLPYFPPPALEDALRGIRVARQATSFVDASALVLGSVGTEQAAESYAAFLAELTPALDALHQDVTVVGVGTDVHAPSGLSPRVRCLGLVPDSQVQSLLASARAVLVFQRFGSGALTRIPEALLAGVPVIGNRVAVRSARHYDGVYCFDDRATLTDLLAEALPTPRVPSRPAGLERAFAAALRRCAAGESTE